MAKRANETELPRRTKRTRVIRSPDLLLEGREKDIALINRLIDRIDQGGSTLVITWDREIGALGGSKTSGCGMRISRPEHDGRPG